MNLAGITGGIGGELAVASWGLEAGSVGASILGGTAGGMVGDFYFQQAMMGTGLQDSYSATQTLAMGGVGGFLGFVSHGIAELMALPTASVDMAAARAALAADAASGGRAAAELGGAAGGAACGTRAAPSALAPGTAYETERLAQLGLAKNTTTWRPTKADIDSSAFKVIVGEAKYTRSGLPKGTIIDATKGGLREIKSGASTLDSSYQLRLQTYYAIKNGLPYTIETTRPVNQTFQAWLARWGVDVVPLQ